MSKTVLVKNLTLGLAATLTAGVFGYLFANFIATGTLTSLISALVAGVFFLAAFLIQVLLSKNRGLTAVFVVASVLAMSAFFLGHFSLVLIAAVGIALVMFFLAYHNGQSELENNLDLRFIRASRVVMGLATMALAIFASFAYFASFDLKDPVAAKKNLEVLVRPVEPIISGYIPGFTARSSLIQIASRLIPEELRLASQETQNAFVQEFSTGLSQTLSNTFGVRVSPGDSVIDILYNGTIGRILSLSALAQSLVLIGVALAFFFLIKFALFFVDWLAVLLAWAVFKILLAARFFRFDLQNVPKKVIMLE